MSVCRPIDTPGQRAAKKVAVASASESPHLRAMLVSAPPTPRRDRAAIATSLAIHCCVLQVLAMLPGATFPTTDPDERMLLMGQIRIEHRERPHITQTRRAAAIPVAPQ